MDLGCSVALDVDCDETDYSTDPFTRFAQALDRMNAKITERRRASECLKCMEDEEGQPISKRPKQTMGYGRRVEARNAQTNAKLNHVPSVIVWLLQLSQMFTKRFYFIRDNLLLIDFLFKSLFSCTMPFNSFDRTKLESAPGSAVALCLEQRSMSLLSCTMPFEIPLIYGSQHNYSNLFNPLCLCTISLFGQLCFIVVMTNGIHSLWPCVDKESSSRNVYKRSLQIPESLLIRLKLLRFTG